MNGKRIMINIRYIKLYRGRIHKDEKNKHYTSSCNDFGYVF